jgi:hypothetical protein
MYGHRSRNTGIGIRTWATLAERYSAERSGSSKMARVVGSAKEARAFMKEGGRERKRETEGLQEFRYDPRSIVYSIVHKMYTPEMQVWRA